MLFVVSESEKLQRFGTAPDLESRAIAFLTPLAVRLSGALAVLGRRLENSGSDALISQLESMRDSVEGASGCPNRALYASLLMIAISVCCSPVGLEPRNERTQV
jgi:hypothetical protein